jgi:hypothetical protein
MTDNEMIQNIVRFRSARNDFDSFTLAELISAASGGLGLIGPQQFLDCIETLAAEYGWFLMLPGDSQIQLYDGTLEWTYHGWMWDGCTGPSGKGRHISVPVQPEFLKVLFDGEPADYEGTLLSDVS